MGAVISGIVSFVEGIICGGAAVSAAVAPIFSPLVSAFNHQTPAPSVSPADAYSSCQTECTVIAYLLLIIGILVVLTMIIFAVQKLISPFVACCRCAKNKRKERIEEERYQGLLGAIEGGRKTAPVYPSYAPTSLGGGTLKGGVQKGGLFDEFLF